MAFQLPQSITAFLQSKGLSTVLNLLQFVPIPAVGAAAATLENIKNAVVEHPDFKALSSQDQQQAIDLFKAESDRLAQQDNTDLEEYKAQLSDVANARQRQISLAQLNVKDWLFFLSGIIGLSAFGYVVWAVVHNPIPPANEKMFDILIGDVMGVAQSIFIFNFGSTRGSQSKDDTIAKLSKQ